MATTSILSIRPLDTPSATTVERKSPSRVVLEDLRRNRRKSANVRGYLGGNPSTSTNPTGSAETTSASTTPSHHYHMEKNLRRAPSWTQSKPDPPEAADSHAPTPYHHRFSLKQAVTSRNPLPVAHKPRFLVLDSSTSTSLAPGEGVLRKFQRSSASSVASSTTASSTCPSTAASEASDHRGHSRPRRPNHRLPSLRAPRHEEDAEEDSLASSASVSSAPIRPFVVELSEQLEDLDESYMLSVYCQADAYQTTLTLPEEGEPPFLGPASVSSLSNGTSSTTSSLRSTRRRHRGAFARRKYKGQPTSFSSSVSLPDTLEDPEEALANPFRETDHQTTFTTARPSMPAARENTQEAGWAATMEAASKQVWKDWTVDRGWLPDRRYLHEPPKTEAVRPSRIVRMPPQASTLTQQDVSWFSSYGGKDREEVDDDDDRKPILSNSTSSDW